MHLVFIQQHNYYNQQLLSSWLFKQPGRTKACIPIHSRNAASKTDVLCPRHNPTRDEATCAPNSDHLLLNLLPDSWHAKKRRRPYFFHCVTQGTLRKQTFNWSPHHLCFNKCFPEWSWISWFFLGYLLPLFSVREPLGIAEEVFYRLDAIRVIKPTVPKHWREKNIQINQSKRSLVLSVNTSMHETSFLKARLTRNEGTCCWKVYHHLPLQISMFKLEIRCWLLEFA